ncbi:MAG: DUF1269 domain-containing protein [Thermomicrobiales bacterium]|nr:DUF1269 domain-containing protein [Thermomicrobiales bacterium]
MSHLVAIAYPDERRAAEAFETLQRLDAAGTLALEDVAAVSRDREGGIKLDKVAGSAAAGGAGGLFLGTLIGLAFFVPVYGAVFGLAVGAMAGKFAGLGRGNDLAEFERQVAEQLTPQCSALLLLVRDGDPEAAIAALQPHGGTVVRTTLPNEIEDQLRAALGQLAGATA